MKFLVRFKKDKRQKEFIDMQSVSEEYIHEYHEIEDLEHKDGYYVAYEYDKESKKIVGKYVEIPKSSEELMREEIEKLKRAIAENAPDTSELDALKASKRLSKEDLSELDNL